VTEVAIERALSPADDRRHAGDLGELLDGTGVTGVV
jgi:hypothetical protein